MVLINFFNLRVVLLLLNFLNINRHFLILYLYIISRWPLLCTLLLILIVGICNFILFYIFELYILRRYYFFNKFFTIFRLLIILLQTIWTLFKIVSSSSCNLDNCFFNYLLFQLKAFVIVWSFLYLLCFTESIIIVHLQHTLPHWLMNWMVLILLYYYFFIQFHIVNKFFICSFSSFLWKIV